VREFEENQYVVMATSGGVVKKTSLAAYSNPRAGGIIAINLDEGDTLITALLVEKDREIFLATEGGKAIRFDEREIRPMGRVARGVAGIKFSAGDKLIGMEVSDPNSTVMTVTLKGYGKRSDVSKYRLQKRAGYGTINIKRTDPSSVFSR
jgi:DNA gyrase subunit A